MNAYRSPSPKRILLSSSTPAVSRFKKFDSPQRNHINNESRNGDKYLTQPHEFSPIVGAFSSPSDSIHRSSLANSLDHKDLSTAELLDKLSKDPSAFAAHLRDSLLYGEQLQAPTLQTLDSSSRCLQDSAVDRVSSQSTFSKRIRESLAQNIKSDISMLLEYKEVYPEVLEAQAKNVFVEEASEEYEADTNLLLHPLLDSDR